MVDNLAEQENTQQGEKTFTQEEVNRIVQERLARVKTEPSGKEEELNTWAKELRARELRLTARESFTEKKLPAELLDILDYSDEKKLQENIDILEKVYASHQSEATEKQKEQVPDYKPFRGGLPPLADPVREAMGLK